MEADLSCNPSWIIYIYPFIFQSSGKLSCLLDQESPILWCFVQTHSVRPGKLLTDDVTWHHYPICVLISTRIDKFEILPLIHFVSPRRNTLNSLFCTSLFRDQEMLWWFWNKEVKIVCLQPSELHSLILMCSSQFCTVVIFSRKIDVHTVKALAATHCHNTGITSLFCSSLDL